MVRLARLTGADRSVSNAATIAGYRVISRIVEGPMSTIYRCENKDGVGVVAVKVLSQHAALVASKLTERLGKPWEGQRAITLKHPNVVRTLEYGKWGNTYYLVMEYLDGGNLSEHIETGSSALDGKRLSILTLVAHGLTYVHQQGIIHRDVCPRNIMLAEDGTPRLIDFGVAMGARDILRNTGARTGRSSYMAPELVRDNIFNEQTDIYAFGVTLYETLTGRKPFEGDGRLSTMHLQLNLAPFPPSRYNPDIPPELEAVTMKATSKKPDIRYRKMDELFVALTALRHLQI